MLQDCTQQTQVLQRQLRSENTAKLQLQAQLQAQAVTAQAATVQTGAEVGELRQAASRSDSVIQHLRRQVDGQNEQLRRLGRLTIANQQVPPQPPMTEVPPSDSAPPDAYVFSHFDDPAQAPAAKAAPGAAKQPPTLPKEPPVLQAPPPQQEVPPTPKQHPNAEVPPKARPVLIEPPQPNPAMNLSTTATAQEELKAQVADLSHIVSTLMQALPGMVAAAVRSATPATAPATAPPPPCLRPPQHLQ